MIFDKLKIKKQKQVWERAIEENLIASVKMLDDGSLLVHEFIDVELGDRTYSQGNLNRYGPNEVSTKALLEILGSLSPGEVRRLGNPFGVVDWEQIYSQDDLAKGLTSGFYCSARLSDEGGIDLKFILDDGSESLVPQHYHSEDYLRTILSFTGPLKPGEVRSLRSVNESGQEDLDS